MNTEQAGKIPEEIKKQIEAKVSLHLAIVTNDEIIINPKKHKLLVEFAEFGYSFAIAGRSKNLEREKSLEKALRTMITEYEYTMKTIAMLVGQVYSENNVLISAKELLKQ